MSYLGLARKWRPQTFEDLIGQNHITATLTNAIKTNRIIQGYLFTGTRGIGKTSVARILSKVLRCTSPVGPATPCNKCSDCIEIAEGRSVDVLEIDGASNNGVDAVREIRENAKYLPSNGARKIYIIDEVHMLTTAAFNALLKTLEEPPPHVIFIFATTDPQKIPETVLSRCQRFDFRRVSQKDLFSHVKKICQTENVSITDEALAILSREAEGSMRDALSLLDQVLGTHNAHITADVLTDSLGLIDKKTVLDCVTAVLKRQPLTALEAVGKVYLHGFDLRQFAKEILRYLRALLVLQLLAEKNAEPSAFLDLSEADLIDLKALVSSRSSEDLDMLFRMLNFGMEELDYHQSPKLILDVLLVKMATAEEMVMLENAVEPEPTVSQEPLAANTIARKWPNVVSFIKSKKPMLGSILENFALESVKTEVSGTFLIALSYTKDHSFYKDQLVSRAYSDLLLQYLKSYFGHAARLEYREVLSNKPFESLEEQSRRAVLENETIRTTQSLLGAKLEKLEIRR